MRKLLTSLVLMLFLSTPALAYDDYSDIYTYFKGGIHFWDSDNINETGLKLAVGQQLGTFMGVEAHFAMGGEDSDTKTKLEHLFGLYGKANLPLAAFNPYAKLGFTSASMKYADSSSSEFEFSYGLGVEVSATPNVFVDLEYMVYMDTSDLELNAFTLSVGYKLK